MRRRKLVVSLRVISELFIVTQSYIEDRPLMSVPLLDEGISKKRKVFVILV